MLYACVCKLLTETPLFCASSRHGWCGVDIRPSPHLNPRPRGNSPSPYASLRPGNQPETHRRHILHKTYISCFWNVSMCRMLPVTGHHVKKDNKFGGSFSCLQAFHSNINMHDCDWPHYNQIDNKTGQVQVLIQGRYAYWSDLTNVSQRSSDTPLVIMCKPSVYNSARNDLKTNF